MDYAKALSEFGGDAETLWEVIDVFKADLPDQLADMRASVSARDAEATRRAAHKLRGAASNLTAVSLSEAAAALEERAASGIIDEMDTNLALIERRIRDLVDFLDGMSPTDRRR